MRTHSLRPLARTAPVALVALGLLAAGDAAAQEYREFTLSDGRVLYSELLATEAAGLKIRVPQGITEIPFTLLVDMVPAEQSAYASQSPWKVYVDAPVDIRTRLVAAFTAMPGVTVLGEPGVADPFTPQQSAQLLECFGDLDCMTWATASSPWMWLVTASAPTPDGPVHVVARLNSGPTAFEATYARDDKGQLQAATWTLLDMRPDGELAPLSGPLFDDAVVDTKGSKGSKGPKEPKPARAGGGALPASAAFVPVPGWTALKQGDGAGFGIALGAVIPATALTFAASGYSSQRAPEALLFTAGGFYVSTVLANQWVAKRGGAADAVVVPYAQPDGGGVSVHLRR